MDRKDHVVIESIRRGNKEAFKELFERYYTSLCSYAISFVDDTKVAEDIVQDIFVKLWEKRQSINIEHALSAYLYRTVYYNVLRYFRKKPQEHGRYNLTNTKLLEAEIYYKHYEEPFSNISHEELKRALKSAIETLPEKTREIFILSRKKNLKNKEIASFLNISIKTVEYHIAKALVVLREQLKQY